MQLHAFMYMYTLQTQFLYLPLCMYYLSTFRRKCNAKVSDACMASGRYLHDLIEACYTAFIQRGTYILEFHLFSINTCGKSEDFLSFLNQLPVYIILKKIDIV